MDRLSVTTAYASPFNFQWLYEGSCKTGLRPHALSRIMVGGGRLAPDLAARADAQVGAEVFNTCGSSRTSSIAQHRPGLAPDQPGLAGRICPDIGMRFLDEAGLPGAAEGELRPAPARSQAGRRSFRSALYRCPRVVGHGRPRVSDDRRCLRADRPQV
jgi:acyl-coenzyme A synthetase/AMP-(fatty) acid ligase